MSENPTFVFNHNRIELTPTQIQVIEILNSSKSQKYSLADWYLGAIYAVKNIYNPDRFSQAAQSLRELLEKLPRVFVESEVQESRSGLSDLRRNLYSQLCSDKKRYEGVWKDKLIDNGLDKTIIGVDRYLELNQIPTRKEQIHSVMSKIDPMHNTFNREIRLEKTERFYSLWKRFEALAHHNTHADEMLFFELVAQTESLVIDLLAPLTAQDQIAIRTILVKPQPAQTDVEKMLELIKRRGANYAYFFKTVNNPIWIKPLTENRFFKNLPNVEAVGDGRIITPTWWPIFFLQRVSDQSPEQVVEIILGLEQTDNPHILREIFSIGCDLKDTALSLRLKPLIMQFLKSPYRWGEEELIVKILNKWGSDQATRYATSQIIQYVIAFQPDTKEDDKRTRRKENSQDFNTLLEPLPRFEQWEYQQILEKGILPLAEHEPYQVSRILIDAVANMIRLGIHCDDFEKGRGQDYSEFWCKRLVKTNREYQDVKATLMQTLTFVCEQVYDNAPDSIQDLDQTLRNHQWKVFKRLRNHLFALNPNDKTLPWIRELILGHDDYTRWEHHYEFQLMIRKACEHFGPSLLSEGERSRIFEAILSGPSKDDDREFLGESYSEDAFQGRQYNFHRAQFRPFALLLYGKYKAYYDELMVVASDEAVSDNSYPPFESKGGVVSSRSPKSAEILEKLTDDELLDYLNDWNDEHHEKDNWLVKINISALADVFQSLFKEKIVLDSARLPYWLANRDNIARPVYVAAMVKAMQELVKNRNYDNLDLWLEFCSWVLSHQESSRADVQPESHDESREHPDWGSSHRAVVDFIDVCVNKETDIPVPITARGGLASLLQQVCHQSDWRLDHDHPLLLNQNDPLAEAINNTRSRGIESLINFGFWIRHHLPDDSAAEVTEILSKRMVNNAVIPLTRPEQALLGMHYNNLCVLDVNWVSTYQGVLFPHENLPVWLDAFNSYISFNQPFKGLFEFLRGDFEFAIDNLNALKATKNNGKELVDSLGQHVFTYYLWELFPLMGDESLLARFYNKTSADREHWTLLFDHVGRSLNNSDKNLDRSMIDRAIAYFDWRFESAEPIELQKFTFWLGAECLPPEWRLRSYSKILNLGPGKRLGNSLELRALNKLLPKYIPLVIECFAKITDTLDQGTQMYISAEQARPLLMAGMNTDDKQVRQNAERAIENLLRLGSFDYLDIV